MSAWMVSNETISKIANLIATYNIVGFNGFGFSFPEVLEKRFKYKKASEIFTELAEMNIESLKQRYPRDYQELVGDVEFLPNADIWQSREKGLTYHYQLLKSLHCFTYQCCEGSVPDCELYKAIEKLTIHLSNYIISKMPEYQTAEWK